MHVKRFRHPHRVFSKKPEEKQIPNGIRSALLLPIQSSDGHLSLSKTPGLFALIDNFTPILLFDLISLAETNLSYLIRAIKTKGHRRFVPTVALVTWQLPQNLISNLYSEAANWMSIEMIVENHARGVSIALYVWWLKTSSFSRASPWCFYVEVQSCNETNDGFHFA